MLKGVCLVVTGLVVVTVLNAASPSKSQEPQIQRGSYLVNNVAGCGDCHSPRMANGAPDKSHWLQRAPLFFAPLQPIPNWAKQAPDIAGLTVWNEEDIVKLLETGALPNGQRPNPPMPSYRMRSRDARAVVAYLKSLATVKP
jgi:mono/diheme cytochrome c family protein